MGENGLHKPIRKRCAAAPAIGPVFNATFRKRWFSLASISVQAIHPENSSVA
jgi:hypothetical protein